MTPEKLVLEQEVDSVTLPGTEGEMTILPHHAAMLATLKPGKMRYSLGSKVGEKLFIAEGVVEVLKNHILILTKSVQAPEANPLYH